MDSLSFTVVGDTEILGAPYPCYKPESRLYRAATLPYPGARSPEPTSRPSLAWPRRLPWPSACLRSLLAQRNQLSPTANEKATTLKGCSLSPHSPGRCLRGSEVTHQLLIIIFAVQMLVGCASLTSGTSEFETEKYMVNSGTLCQGKFGT